jgi:hypothetical protein
MLAIASAFLLAYQTEKHLELQRQRDHETITKLGNSLHETHDQFMARLDRLTTFEEKDTRHLYESEFDYRLSKIGQKKNRPNPPRKI